MPKRNPNAPLLDHAADKVRQQLAPLAERMRPRTLVEFVGQAHVLAPGRLLRRAIEADQLSSVIFSGPPGSGKTTLARIIAQTTRSDFLSINAVLAGISDIRQCVEQAQEAWRTRQIRTLLFIDEVHRFNKAQQDALLPHVENGTLVLIGATTENPHFEVNKALLSRSRIFQLHALEAEHIARLLDQALADSERGLGQYQVTFAPEAREHLAQVASGDARSALNALELAVQTTPPDANGVVPVTLEVAEDSIQRRAVLYDKDGDVHFDTASAFIKAMRGSDPDAALYWMAKMILGGEEPRFLFRRMTIFAAEDVGLADPQALSVVTSAAQAFNYVGMPEGRFLLAEACLYLSTAHKSNSAFAFFDALRTVESESKDEVPDPIKDANRDKESFGHGEGYLYPHAYRDHWVAQQYLPDALQGRVFYQPSDQGYEQHLRVEVLRRREAIIAALLESEAKSQGPDWEERTYDTSTEVLSQIRTDLFVHAQLQRNSLTLALEPASGLLTPELRRQTPDEGVHVWLPTGGKRALWTGPDAESEHPACVWHEGTLENITEQLASSHIRFERILGWFPTEQEPPISGQLAALSDLLAPAGRLLFALSLPSKAPRLSSLLAANLLDASTKQALLDAEQEIYPPLQNKDGTLTKKAFGERLQVGYSIVVCSEKSYTTELRLSAHRIQEWLEPRNNTGYFGKLRSLLAPATFQEIAQAFKQHVPHKTHPWSRTVLQLVVVRQ